jgi:hypothetical protein
VLKRFATYLQSAGEAWRNASQEQRNKLAKILFANIRIENDIIKGVTPCIEYTPFFILNHLEHSSKCQGKSSRSGSDGHCTFIYDFSVLKFHELQEILDPLYFLDLPPHVHNFNQIPREKWLEVAERKTKGESLRQLAKDYHVSHEAVRQVLLKVQQQGSQ